MMTTVATVYGVVQATITALLAQKRLKSISGAQERCSSALPALTVINAPDTESTPYVTYINLP